MRMYVTIICVLVTVAFVQGVIKVDTKTNFLVDDYGRVRIFHGVNAVYKLPPWHPNTEGFDPQFSLSAQDAANLQNWGFNAVRLGVMWPGVEPQQGQYNYTYIDVMEDIVNTLANFGIYAIIDFHQDVLNRKFCGEGIPDWAVITDELTLPFALPVADVYTLDKNGYPSIQDCLTKIFGEYYFAQKTSNAFQHLYDNTNGIQDSFAAYWDLLSSTFNNTPNILGYEVINEPWAGDIFALPDLLLPGTADKVNLQPMYTKLHETIRKNDNEHIIFFEKALSDIISGCGFTQGPGGPTYNDRQVYSYHIYCGPTDSEGDPKYIIECDGLDDYDYLLAIQDIQRLGCGGFLTEFGAMANLSVSIENIGYLTGLSDNYLQSWTYWQFKYFNDITTAGPGESFYDINGNLETNKVKALSRTYAQIISGLPISMQFNPDNSLFQFQYKVDTTIPYPTQIYLNEQFYYPNGYTVKITPSGAATWTSPNTNIILVSPAQTTPNHSTLSVVISAN